MKMDMIPAIINDTGDCCCLKCPRCNNCDCVPGGDGCICRGDGTGDSIESAITCDLIWKEKQPNGKAKYYKVVSGSSQQNQPVVLPTASLTKRGVVQLTNEISDREDLALTPKGAKTIKTALDKETAERISGDSNLQDQINQEKTDRANADADILKKLNKEIDDRKNGDTNLSNSITTITNKVNDAVNKANNAVTSVVSDGNATVTVTKASGATNKFTINNVAHATSADSATNASHATTADSATKATNADHATNADNATHATTADSATKATNADHATVADRLASGSELDTSSVLGAPNWDKYYTTQILYNNSSSAVSAIPSSYTFPNNCLAILKYSVQVPPSSGSVNVSVKVNNTIIYTLNESNGTQAPKSFNDKESYLFKKGDKLSINNNSAFISGSVSITLSILPLG